MANRIWQVLTILWFVGIPISQGIALSKPVEVDKKSKALSHYILAVSHEIDGESTQAYEQYRLSSLNDPSQIDTRMRLVAYDVRFNRLDKAVSELKQIIRMSPDTVQAHYLLALVYSSQKKIDLAVEEYELVLKKAASNNPLNIETYAYLAQLYFAQGKLEKATLQFQNILLLDPDHISANFLLGSIYLDKNKYDKAIMHLRHVISLKPNHDGALNALAYAYAQQGQNLAKAQTMARFAIDLDPSNGAYYDTYGWVLYKQGLYTESLMALQKAETFVQEAIVYDHLGDVYKALNQLTLARNAWRKSLQYDSKQESVRQKLEELNDAQAFEKPSH